MQLGEIAENLFMNSEASRDLLKQIRTCGGAFVLPPPNFVVPRPPGLFFPLFSFFVWHVCDLMFVTRHPTGSLLSFVFVFYPVC